MAEEEREKATARLSKSNAKIQVCGVCCHVRGMMTGEECWWGGSVPGNPGRFG